MDQPSPCFHTALTSPSKENYLLEFQHHVSFTHFWMTDGIKQYIYLNKTSFTLQFVKFTHFAIQSCRSLTLIIVQYLIVQICHNFINTLMYKEGQQTVAHWPAAYFCCCSVAKRVQLFVIPWTAAHQAPLSLMVSQSLLKFIFIDSVMKLCQITALSIHVYIIYGCFHAVMARVQGVATEAVQPINLKYLPSSSLQNRSTSPYLFLALNYYKYWIYEYSSSWFLVGMCRVALLCHRICMGMALANTAKQLSKTVLAIYPITSNTKVPVLQFQFHPPATYNFQYFCLYLISSIFLNVSILVGMHWYLIIGLI